MSLVLVTGGTGSLGMALLPHLMAQNHSVRIMSRDEVKHLDVRRQYPGVDCRLGDVRDIDAVREAMRDIETVIHAASLKQVDISERQPSEYIKTNVLGTLNVLEAARESSTVRRCVGISTDKVPNARQTYGLTKALLEKMFVESHLLAHERGQSYTIARYGNVFASRGSVVPFWAEQRRKGEPLTVTDPAMTRFFFTLADAVKLVDVALAAPSGTIVAQPMPACTLGQLASIFITSTAHLPNAHVTFVGRRPGEKVHEELLTAEEMARTWSYGDHYEYSPLLDLPYYEDGKGPQAYTSDRAPRFTDDALRAMLKEWI